MKRQIIILALATIATIGTLGAQDLTPKKIHAGAGVHGGLGMLLLQPSEQTKMGLSGGIDINAAYFFNETIGVVAGIGGSFTQTGISTENIVSTPERTVTVQTTEGEQSLLTRYEINTPEVEETHKIMALEVPVMFMLQGVPMDFSIEGFHKCYFGVGARVTLPISYSAEGTYSESTTAIGPNVTGSGVTLDEVMPMESYTPDAISYDVKETASNSGSSLMYVMATMEAGAILKFNNGGSMLIGLYGNYALNGTKLNNDKEAYIISTNGDELTTVGFLNSNRVEKFRYFNFGLKVQYNFF